LIDRVSRFLLYDRAVRTDTSPISLHDALPIFIEAHVTAPPPRLSTRGARVPPAFEAIVLACLAKHPGDRPTAAELVDQLETMARSEEHTSELQSRENLVCRLLLEK